MSLKTIANTLVAVFLLAFIGNSVTSMQTSTVKVVTEHDDSHNGG